MTQTTLHEARFRELRIRRNCPGCGARLIHCETARTIRCSFCRSNVAILPLAPGQTPRFAVPIEGHMEDWLLAAKRHLRQASVRVRAFEAPFSFYAPFYRLSTEVLHWWLEPRIVPPPDHDDPAARSRQSGAGVREASIGSLVVADIEYRTGTWEQTLCAIPDIGIPDRALGIRTQAVEVAPLDELFAASEKGVALRPARLRTTLAEAAAREELEQCLKEAYEKTDDAALAQQLISPLPTWQLVYWPYAIVPFEGQGQRGAVVVDARTGRVRGVMGPEFESKLVSQFECAPEDPTAWDFPKPEAQYVHLACPNCSAPIAADPGARIFPCQLCRRTYGVDTHQLREIETVALSGTATMIRRKEEERTRWTGTKPKRDGPATGIPFFRVLDPESKSRRWIYVPAALALQARPLWNLALHFTRRQPRWAETDVPCLPFVVAVDAEGARLRAPFVESFLEAEGSEGWRRHDCGDTADTGQADCTTESDAPVERGARQEVVVQLAWIVFYARGSEWVEPVTGLGLPARALGRHNTNVAP